MHRHVSALGKGEPVQEAIVKHVQERSQLEIGLVNVAHGGGSAMHEEGRGPVGVRVAQSISAERVDVHRHRARQKTEIGTGKRPGHAPVVPTIIEGTIRDGISIGKNRR